MSLEPGTFKVSLYRKAIPNWVKIVCAIRALLKSGVVRDDLVDWVRSLRFDHRPPLQDRPYDLVKQDFEPSQNDPDYIEAIPTKEHDQRTFGRKADAEKTVTTRGSDVGERKHIRDVRNTQTQHDLKMAVKRGDPAAIAKLLHVERRPRPKSKIPSRPFPTRRKRDEKRLSRRHRQ